MDIVPLITSVDGYANPYWQANFYLDKWQYFTSREAPSKISPRIYRPEKSKRCDFQWKNLSCCCGTHVDQNRLKFHPCSINVWGINIMFRVNSSYFMGWTAGYCTRLSWDPVCHFVYAGLLCKYVRMLHIPHIQASNPCIFMTIHMNRNLRWLGEAPF